MSGSTVYIPVDSAQNSMRSILTKEEAEALIHSIPELPLLQIKNDKFLEQEYKTCMKTNCCDEWVKLLKTIYKRRQSRLQTGRKETAIDSKYYKMAEDILYGELAVALDIEKSQVEPYIVSQFQE